jgi:hypothetical protein
MTTRKIFNIITMGLIVFLFFNMFFIPIITNGIKHYSLWEYAGENNANSLRAILIIELALALVVCILQLCNAIRGYRLVYFFIGYYFTYHLTMILNFMEREVLDYSDIGLWLGCIFSFITFIMVLVGNLCSNKRSSPGMMSGGAPVVGYDPKTGKPIYGKPKGFDPQTGEPIYN